MHYRNSKLLQTCNAVLDILLILLAYLCAGLLRVALSLGDAFYMGDLWRFFPLSVLYALVIVCCYAFAGDYATLHQRSKFKELVKLLVLNLIGFALVATILYVFRMSQFSRLLLIYFYLLSVVVAMAKRFVLDRLATAYVRRHDMASRVLIVGSGVLARRVYADVVHQRSSEIEYVGYLAPAQVPELPHYMGNYGELHHVLVSNHIDRIIIAEDSQNVEDLRRMVALAESFHIHVSAVPVYNDMATTHTMPNVVAGIQMVDLTMRPTCEIMGVNIVVTDMNKTLALIENQLENWRGKYICVANVHTTVTAHEDESYRKIQNKAAMALPDGGPLSQYSRQQGFAEAQRVTGPDLMKEILKISAEKGWRHYFYGSTPETLELLQTKIQERYPGVQIAGTMSPPFREMTPQEDADAVARINESRPDFVWVGLGAPKQERWMAAHEDRVQALMVGVGAAFDYEAGNIRRAPMWMQKHNLEWLYRLMQDPKRLFKRYFNTNLKYLLWTWRR